MPLVSPEYNAGASAHGRYALHDIDEHGEITWWTPGPTVTPTGSGRATLPIDRRSFFPPNGSGPNNLNGFQRSSEGFTTSP